WVACHDVQQAQGDLLRFPFGFSPLPVEIPAMMTKEEWLRYSGLNFSEDGRWLRDNIAALFDVENPSKAQSHLLTMADLRFTSAALRASAYPTYEAELFAMAEQEFGPRPSNSSAGSPLACAVNSCEANRTSSDT